MKHAVCGTVALVLSVCKITASEPALQRFEFSSPHMGTIFSISLYATNKTAAEMAARAAFQRVAALDEMMSDYRADSELMQLCDKPYGQPVPVSVDLFSILEVAGQNWKITGGAFDVTIGPFTRLWRFSRRKKTLPSAQELAMARAAFGWEKVRLDAKHKTVTLLAPSMRLDLGGIAKGYAADQALKVLHSNGVTRALVAGSGDIAIGDAPPGEAGWKVGVTPIDAHTNALVTSILLHNAGVSTAGDTEQAIEINGNRYSHIVDPKTGLGMTNRVQVTVIARNAVTSDGLDTGLCILGRERALRTVDSLPNVAAIVLTKEQGTNSVSTSQRFSQVLETHTAP